MIDWTARASAILAKTPCPSTAETDETPIPSVLAVPPSAISKKTIVRAACWLLHFPDLDPVAVAFSPAGDHAGALASYPAAIAAEPIPEPGAVPIPDDLIVLFDACAAAGLYDDADRAALPAMLALDAEGTRGLIEAMHLCIGRCRHCRHFRRPGLSDGYCTGRDDLPHAYGFMHRLPDDGGARCGAFERGPAR